MLTVRTTMAAAAATVVMLLTAVGVEAVAEAAAVVGCLL
jgi:hypothetical protein